MFVVIYRLLVVPGRDKDLIQSWSQLCRLIDQWGDGKGSRLHKSRYGEYIAYAQWPSKELWHHSFEKLPQEAASWRQQLLSCASVEVLHELELIQDELM
jgi:hypothetical protein